MQPPDEDTSPNIRSIRLKALYPMTLGRGPMTRCILSSKAAASNASGTALDSRSSLINT